MKRLMIVVVSLVLVMGLVGSAMAANSLKAGSKAFTVGMGNSVYDVKAYPETGSMFNDIVDLSGKYFVANNLALLAGFGLQSNSGDADASYFSFNVGARKYLKVADFTQFVEGKITYASVKVDPSIVDVTVFDFGLAFGAEYFLGQQFSLEGSIGVGFGSIDNAGVSDTYFGTRTMGVHANFYF